MREQRALLCRPHTLGDMVDLPTVHAKAVAAFAKGIKDSQQEQDMNEKTSSAPL
uniref:hypothetical protein n=1 Tax=Mesorhizobium sp. WSM4875 TaxID=3038539 RepID=UPI0024E207F7|nr:hypothetical protein [Mesorhizobium sp. WSM4875]